MLPVTSHVLDPPVVKDGRKTGIWLKKWVFQAEISATSDQSWSAKQTVLHRSFFHQGMVIRCENCSISGVASG